MQEHPSTIKIDEVEYVRKDSIPAQDGTIRIAVLQRGWVAVGYYTQDGDMCRLSKAAVVRSWGTAKGLGQLAQLGPRQGTVLDPCPDIEWHVLTCILTMRCTEAVWQDKLS